MSNSTSSSNISSGLWSSIVLSSSNSTTTSYISLFTNMRMSSNVWRSSSYIGLLSCVCWSIINILSMWSLNNTLMNMASCNNTTSSSYISMNISMYNFSWMDMSCRCISSVISSFDITSLNIFSLARDVIVLLRIMDDLSFNW